MIQGSDTHCHCAIYLYDLKPDIKLLTFANSQQSSSTQSIQIYRVGTISNCDKSDLAEARKS